ncbi:SusE domain-containing protein [Empedobacter sp. GD03861]|uniref:SusE domain-containing protein n=1 Tax=Empedobacter sp. GD03861 TaxID=2975390 RepID=UPI00244BE9F7|nr:SusE domain-containing protein [Empedobacter sp. GD03861]MDH0673253.1 SusE domain-containing protein [Empedobacter sp. GD03861]
MKNFLKYISIALIGSIAITSCSEDDDLLTVNPSDYQAPELVTPNDNAQFILTEEHQDSIITFSWNKAEYGLDVVPKYSLEFTTKDDSNFANATVLIGNSTTTEFQISFKDLNNKVIDLGVEPNVEQDYIYRVKSELGTQQAEPLVSAVKTITITAYPTDLSTNWGVVGSITNWADNQDIPFWKSEETNVLVAYINVEEANAEIKFRQNGSWDVNFGSNNPTTASDGTVSGSLDAGGNNIKIPNIGRYKVTFNQSDSTFKIEAFTWGVIGDATPLGWDADTALNYDGTIDSWTATIELKVGEFKFRQNKSWDVNYGDSGTPGVLKSGGDNIKVTEAGTYIVTANFSKETYSFVKQ